MPDPVPPRQYYTLQEVAEILSLHRETVRRYLATGNLPGVRVGGPSGSSPWRIRSDWLDKWSDDNIYDPRGGAE